MLKRHVFKNFTEYWYYARCLSIEQRRLILKSIPEDQRKSLERSYIKEGYCDLFYRNDVNIKIDELKEAYGYDLLEIRIKALKGKSIYVPTKFWKVVEEQFKNFNLDVIQFLLGGLKAIPEEKNDQVCLIIHESLDN